MGFTYRPFTAGRLARNTQRTFYELAARSRGRASESFTTSGSPGSDWLLLTVKIKGLQIWHRSC